LIRRPSKVGVLRRRFGVAIRIGIVVFVLCPLVLFVFVLAWIVSTALGIRVGTSIAFSVSLRSIVLFVSVFLLVLVGIVVSFGWLFSRGCAIRQRRRRRGTRSRVLVVTDGRFGFSLLALFVVAAVAIVVGLLFVDLFGGFSSSANSEHSLQSRRGLVDLLVLRHSQMAACFLVFGFQTHWGDLVIAKCCLMTFCSCDVLI